MSDWDKMKSIIKNKSTINALLKTFTGQSVYIPHATEREKKQLQVIELWNKGIETQDIGHQVGYSERRVRQLIKIHTQKRLEELRGVPASV